MNGIRTGNDNIEDYDELREYICSFSKQMGCEDIIRFDKQSISILKLESMRIAE